MKFGLSYDRPAHEPKAESSQTLIPKATTRSSTSHLNVSFIVGALHKTWQALTRVFSRSALRDDLPFKATERASCYTFLLHLVPLGGAAVITSFNLYGYWVGKELSGINNENAPKELALQLTAKLHELLILASLSEALLTHVLKSLAIGHGLPFGSLTVFTKFKDLSYVWSRDFWAMCATNYARKSLLVPLILMCTMLGLAIGPSSATALIPRLDIWPAGQAIMTLNTSSDLLWPSTLEPSATGSAICDDSTLGCFNPLTWDSIAANFFSYWARTTTGGGTASPQRISVPSISSLRTMDIRLKGSLGASKPDFTLVSIQHAVIGDMVNSFRFLTFPSRSAKCRKTWSPAMCSYQDVSWFVSAMQPVVITGCLETPLNTSLVRFPIISHGLSPLETTPIMLNASFGDQTQPQFHWVTLGDSQLLNASIGAVVRLRTSTGARDFACSIQAQWANSITSTSYTSTDYVIGGAVPGLDYAMPIDKKYKSQTVTIDSRWAQQFVESPARPQTNTTAFENFMSLGGTSSNLSIKLEVILSVLFAESMAHTGSGTVPLSITSNNLFLKIHGSLVQQGQVAPATASAANRTAFILKTSMTGYGYGLYTMSGLSMSTLISIVLLCLYSAFAMVHLVWLCISKDPYIVSWREERDMLVTCLWSRFRPSVLQVELGEGEGQEMKRQDRDENVSILKDIVLMRSRKGRAELSFRRRDWPEEI
ncbi:uncharacterized protein Z519_03545 [Cladophialophora bantiana CBS 173.52]|uniref:Uncharacterized protein n=1 Tax=Cladophialophora bantiana (strain ATCC 10958 / CBS 173.52 / CDC B-1940 / NIH 8579) TaxID=1442370 RepID=A0A0D2F2R6_CLAB1|nr:uncharacterized protein Z519_03545 [Cladophialophora bantiana CBS 173.52]KIW96476.1 hypothetical protein Z519_03545 [Cladophialophora bantiana CBS 173.52]